MANIIRLNDLQLVLLSSAAARDNGSLIPLPQNCAQDRARIGKAVSALLRRGLVEELPVIDLGLAWREQDQDPIGLFITGAGRAAIGAEPERDVRGDSGDALAKVAAAGGFALQVDSDPPELAEAEAPAPAPEAPRIGSKIATVVALLEREQGATLAELVEVTGWLPHTTRAALTGLRKKGRAIAKTKRGDATCYRIEAEVAA